MTEESFSVRLKLELSKIRAKTVNARQAVIAGMFAGCFIINSGFTK